MPTAKNVRIEKAVSGDLEWVYVSSNQKREIDTLKKRYGFHSVDLKETLPPLQRTKLVVRDEYLFLILLYPVFDRATRAIYSAEVDFFISKNRLVMVDTGNLAPLRSLFRACLNSTDEIARQKKLCMSEDVTHLIYSILNELLENVYPMLVHVSLDMDALETRLFTDYGKDLIQELLRIKTNVVNIRKSIQGHQIVIRRLIDTSADRLRIHELEMYFDRLVDHTKEIWDTLELQRDTINALHETNASLINFRINDIMKTLTIFSVILLPLSLIAGVFGMNAARIPFVEGPNGFWVILGLMLCTGVGLLLFFKRKKWL